VEVGQQERILEKLNMQHEAIKFTMEQEEEGMIPFLDLKLNRIRSRIEVDVYRKPTDSPLCIPADSHHPWAHKSAAFESALYRMWNLPLNSMNREKELNYIKKMALLNGYTTAMVDGISEKHKIRKHRTEHTRLAPMNSRERAQVPGLNKNKIITIPYFKEITEPLERMLKKRGITVAYQSRGSLKEIIGRTKPKRPDMERSGIYEIQCNDCELTYIGQTKRRIETRDAEHRRACEGKDVSRSAIAAHCVVNEHKKGECLLMKSVEKPFLLDAYESLYIARGHNLMNAAEAPIKSVLFSSNFDR
jgi:hypothetical protein